MKKIFLICFSFFLLFFLGEHVEAKNLENTCVYKGSYSYMNGFVEEQADLEITCNMYDNVSYKCSSNIKGYGPKIENWGKTIGDIDFSDSSTAKEYYDKNHTCLPYMVFIDKAGGINSVRYAMYGAEDLTRAEKIDSNFPNNIWPGKVIMPLEGTQTSKKDEIKSQITKFNNLPDYYSSLSNCLQVRGKYTLRPSLTGSKSTCVSTINEISSDIKKWNALIQEMIDSGELSENDQIVKNYYEAVYNVKDQFSDGMIDEIIQEPGKIIDVEDPGVSGLPVGEINCDNIFGTTFGRILKQILSFVRFAVPIIILGFSVIDFIKASAMQAQEEIKKSAAKFAKRMIIGVVIFLLPTIIDVILDLAGITYGTCGIM